jgi:hypothetical protein
MYIEHNKEKKNERENTVVLFSSWAYKIEDHDMVMRETVYPTSFFHPLSLSLFFPRQHGIVDTCQKAQNLLFFNHTLLE